MCQNTCNVKSEKILRYKVITYSYLLGIGPECLDQNLLEKSPNVHLSMTDARGEMTDDNQPIVNRTLVQKPSDNLVDLFQRLFHPFQDERILFLVGNKIFGPWKLVYSGSIVQPQRDDPGRNQSDLARRDIITDIVNGILTESVNDECSHSRRPETGRTW